VKALLYVFLLLRCNHILGVTNTLASVYASFTKAMVHCICTYDAQLWHFVFVTLLSTGRSQVIKKLFSRSQSKTRWPSM